MKRMHARYPIQSAAPRTGRHWLSSARRPASKNLFHPVVGINGSPAIAVAPQTRAT
jgi:hypothetical protein